MTREEMNELCYQEEMLYRIIDFLGTQTVLDEIIKWLDTDAKAQMIEDIYRTYDLDIA